jgi:E3 ubiquitin-protein ligase DOA10
LQGVPIRLLLREPGNPYDDVYGYLSTACSLIIILFIGMVIFNREFASERNEAKNARKEEMDRDIAEAEEAERNWANDWNDKAATAANDIDTHTNIDDKSVKTDDLATSKDVESSTSTDNDSGSETAESSSSSSSSSSPSPTRRYQSKEVQSSRGAKQAKRHVETNDTKRATARKKEDGPIDISNDDELALSSSSPKRMTGRLRRQLARHHVDAADATTEASLSDAAKKNTKKKSSPSSI